MNRKNKARIGNYIVLRQISEGRFGRTYEAEHLLLKEKACIKQNINLSEEDTDLFIQEAKNLWHIHHYSLPTIRDFLKCPDGSYALVMNYVEGTGLEKIVKGYRKRDQKIDPEDVCWITQRLLNALYYLHYKGIVHGDIKPQHIIVQPDIHNAVLVDLGFSKLHPNEDTKPEGYTPIFAPPEVVAKKPPLPESDLYSLALTMIYAFGGNPAQKTYPPGTPRQLQDFYNSFLKKNPLDRPCWEQEDLVKKLSDIRVELFGRPHSKKGFKIYT